MRSAVRKSSGSEPRSSGRPSSPAASVTIFASVWLRSVCSSTWVSRPTPVARELRRQPDFEFDRRARGVEAEIVQRGVAHVVADESRSARARPARRSCPWRSRASVSPRERSRNASVSAIATASAAAVPASTDDTRPRSLSVSVGASLRHGQLRRRSVMASPSAIHGFVATPADAATAGRQRRNRTCSMSVGPCGKVQHGRTDLSAGAAGYSGANCNRAGRSRCRFKWFCCRCSCWSA